MRLREQLAQLGIISTSYNDLKSRCDSPRAAHEFYLHQTIYWFSRIVSTLHSFCTRRGCQTKPWKDILLVVSKFSA